MLVTNKVSFKGAIWNSGIYTLDYTYHGWLSLAGLGLLDNSELSQRQVTRFDFGNYINRNMKFLLKDQFIK